MEYYQVNWEKWRDPYGDDENEVQENNRDDDCDDDDDEDIDYEDNKYTKFSKPSKLLATPLGIIPLTEYTSPSKIFNFWVGHTNFNIYLAIAKIIEQIDGVELLDVYTRYRFRIGIGKVFKDAEVMHNIQEALYQWLANTNKKI